MLDKIKNLFKKESEQDRAVKAIKKLYAVCESGKVNKIHFVKTVRSGAVLAAKLKNDAKTPTKKQIAIQIKKLSLSKDFGLDLYLKCKRIIPNDPLFEDTKYILTNLYGCWTFEGEAIVLEFPKGVK